MKLKDISVNDIRKKKYWKVISFNEANPELTELLETNQVSSEDIIIHPAVLVEKNSKVYPCLISKYYEDGGEVGEYFIFTDDRWKFIDSPTELMNEVEGEYLGFISTLDIHEFQEGSFDNRKENYKRFDFYASQIGNDQVIPFSEKNSLPKKVFDMTIEQKVELVRNLLLDAKTLHENQKISQGNKKVTQAYEIIDILKKDNKGKTVVYKLLSDTEKCIRMTMMYQLLDIYRKECMKMIKKVAKEKTVEGFAAKINLKTIKEKGTLA